MAILLKNGLVYQEGEFIKEDVLISGSKIQAIGLDLPEEGAEVYDLKGKLLAPGLVDIHEHYREPGFTYKETIKTGSEAAARGGFTTVCTMPNVDPVPDDLETFEKQLALNEANSCVHLKQYGAITEDLTSDKVVDMAALKDAGAFAFSNDGHGIQQAGTMYEAMQEAAKVGLAICEHIQDDSLYHHGVMNAGKKAEELGLPGILGVSESAQLARDLVLAQATGVHYHACHVSTKESVELIRIAKEYGINVTAEAAPHHLLLSEEEIDGNNGYYKMNPPLRSKEDQFALIEGMLDGTIDLIATDHAPHSREEKAGDMRKAAFGIIGNETAFACLYTKFVKSGQMELSLLLDLMSYQPAKLFGLDASVLAPGKEADLAVFDLDHAEKLAEEDYLSKGVNTPFTGQEVYGMTALTFVDDAHMEKLLVACPWYAKLVLPAGTYAGYDEDCATITVKATLVCRADLDDDTAYTIVKTIMESKDDIIALHEKGNSLDLTFATEGIAVPFAAGAAKYFAENGITVETAD